MGFKQKLIGFLVVIAGALPFLLKMKFISDYFSKYSFLSGLAPGSILYQILIIILGVFLIWEFKPRQRR